MSEASEIRYNDRVFVLGYTGSGKSELINRLFGFFEGGSQRVLLDTKPEFGLPGVDPVSSPVALAAALERGDPIVHYQCEAPKPAEIGKVFGILRQRRRLIVCVHELSDLCDYDANKTPSSVSGYLSKGRAQGLGMIGGTQRPVGVPKRAFTDADHVFIFSTGFPEPGDMKAAASAAGMQPRELEARLAELHAAGGPHAFLHIDRRARTCTPNAPLSQSERDAIMVGRPQAALSGSF